MPLTRLLYFSENQIDPSRGSTLSQLSSILAASNRNNRDLDITGALVFDEWWFLQALEGERDQVWQTLKRIEDDDRHAGVVVVDARAVSTRLFGNWWMGLAKRDEATEQAFAPSLRGGRLEPARMPANEILDLMVRLSKVGMSRKLADAA